MKLRIIILVSAILLASSACHKRRTPTVDPWVQKATTQENVITEGRGWDAFRIGMSMDSVFALLGHNYTKTIYGTYSTEYVYDKLGLTFYHYNRDSIRKEVFSLHFQAPFKGKTSRGIMLNQSTMIDAENIHGQGQWFTADDADNWYQDFGQIICYVKRDMSLPQYPLDEELHRKKVIYKVSIKKR